MVCRLALVGFGLTDSTAVLGSATYRLAQYFFPILLGGVLYATLRVGPWSIQAARAVAAVARHRRRPVQQRTRTRLLRSVRSASQGHGETRRTTHVDDELPLPIERDVGDDG